MKNYKEIKISFEPFNTDIISGYLWQLPIDGILEENDFIIVSVSKPNINKATCNKLLKKLVQEKIINSFSITSSTIKNKNWNDKWEKKIKVIKVTDRIVIKPTFRKYKSKKNETVITIDPKMSFGTGEHETTKLVIQLLEKHIKPNDNILDVGTGTGILAIVSVKLGAAYALGIDNDEWCFENGIENIYLNNVENNVEIRTAEINKVKKKNFDVVIANIQKNVLLEIASELYAKTKKDGLLVLSGLLYLDEKEIKKRYKELGFKFIEKIKMNEWIALVFKKVS